MGVYRNPVLEMDSWCDPDLLAIEAPAVNGVGTARAMARLYGEVARGVLVRPESVAARGCGRASGHRPAHRPPAAIRADRYELAGTSSVLGPALDAIGHTGAGGGAHGAWPSLHTGFSFLTADLRSLDADRRATVVLDALHAAVSRA